MDDFERRKKRWLEKKNTRKILTDTLAKTSQNIFAYSFVSRHSNSQNTKQIKMLRMF